MRSFSRRGMIAGAFAGGVAAVTNWDGHIVVAASSVIAGAAIGWVVGFYFGKRRSVD